jgi:hypothetical protein
MSDGPRKIYLGTISVEEGEATPVFDLPDADPDVLAKAIAEAEAEKARLKLAASERLHEMFLKSERHD